MINTLLSVVLTASAVWAGAPRFFLLCDALLARRRLQSDFFVVPEMAFATSGTKSGEKGSSATEFLSARGFNELARHTRAHLPLRDAVAAVTNNSISDEWREFAKALNSHLSIEEALEPFVRQAQFSLSAHLVRASISDGTFAPSALDHAAMLMRDAQRTREEIAVASAHANVTMRMLTRVPLYLIVTAVFISDSFRGVITSPGMLAVAGIAVLLSRLGSAWTRTLIRGLYKPNTTDELLQLIAVLSVHVRSGYSLPGACLRLKGLNSLGDSVAYLLQKGLPFDEALTPLSSHSDSFGDDVASLLIAAYRDGQPVLETINALSHEARQHREHLTQVLIRKLPSRLAAPVVLCALPSFIMLIVVPLMLAQMGTLSGSLPGTFPPP